MIVGRWSRWRRWRGWRRGREQRRRKRGAARGELGVVERFDVLNTGSTVVEDAAFAAAGRLLGVVSEGRELGADEILDNVRHAAEAICAHEAAGTRGPSEERAVGMLGRPAVGSSVQLAPPSGLESTKPAEPPSEASDSQFQKTILPGKVERKRV